MGLRFLKAEELEKLIADDKFTEVDEIDEILMMKFKLDKILFIKIPTIRCEKNPYDSFVWSKTKKDSEGKVFQHLEYTFCYYFSSSPAEIVISFTPNKKLGKTVKEQLKNVVLPMRTISNAVKVAHEMGISVSRRQLASVARNAPNVIYQKSGPRSRTTLQMAQDLAQSFPDNVWFDYNEATRKRDIKALLAQNPSGIFFPSRLHIDTTYNLGDMYVSIVLGETSRFKTKSSQKSRVVPLAYIVHSSRGSASHRLCANLLKAEFDKIHDPSDIRKIPCILMDGEIALEQYSEESGKWRAGILGAFDEETFDRRLQRSQSKIDHRIFDWLKSNKSMLMSSSSAVAKLRAGHILQFSTNNQNENYNAYIKASISKRNSVPELIRKLNLCCNDKLRECFLSGVDCSEYVYYTADVDGLTVEEKIDSFESAGLLAPRVLALNVPLRIAQGFDLDKLYIQETSVKNLTLLMKDDNTYHLVDVTKDDRHKYCQVEHKNDHLQCWTCEDTLPSTLCCHIIFVLCRLDEDIVERYWSGLTKNLFKPKQVNSLPGTSGSKLSDRIGTKNSAKNYIRTMTDISSYIANDSEMSTISVDSTDLPPSHGSSTPYPIPAASTSQSNITFSPPSTSTPVLSSQPRSFTRTRNRTRHYTPPYSTSSDADSTIY